MVSVVVETVGGFVTVTCAAIMGGTICSSVYHTLPLGTCNGSEVDAKIEVTQLLCHKRGKQRQTHTETFLSYFSLWKFYPNYTFRYEPSYSPTKFYSSCNQTGVIEFRV